MKWLMIFFIAMAAALNAQIHVAPAIVGSGETDSIIVSFCTFDTTLYPVIKDADSIIALRYGPGNALIDSLTQSSSRIARLRSGWYEIHYRAANATGDRGVYRMYVRARIGGDWRGAATCSYEVIGDGVGDYFASLMETGSQSGSGAYACTLYVLESGSNEAVQGMNIRVMNGAESATVATGATDVNGRVVFALDADDYHVYAGLSGYNQLTIPQAIEVRSTGNNDTIRVERFAPDAAPSASLARVYGYVNSLDGRGIEGVVVTARIQKSPLLFEGAVISPFALTTATDDEGYWYLDLIPSDDLDPDDTKYEFTIHYPSGTIMRKQIVVPKLASYWLRW